MSTILITSGGTKVKIDEVRHIGNMSSGRFGAELAREALLLGHTVIFLHAKGSERPDVLKVELRKGAVAILEATRPLHDKMFMHAISNNLCSVEYTDFDDYAAKLEKWSKGAYGSNPPDVIMLAAAVSDYGMPASEGKISSDKGEVTFTLTRLPKLISKVKGWAPDTRLVGFKLLVDASGDEMAAAVQKQFVASGCDFVVANDLRSIKQGQHTVHVHKRGSTPVTFSEHVAQNVVAFITKEMEP